MTINQVLPFISTAVMLWFTVDVSNVTLYAATRRFCFGALGWQCSAQAVLLKPIYQLAWNKWMFFIWYLFGAALNAAWLGHGTLYLLARKKWRHVVTVMLVAGSLFAGNLMLQAMPKLDGAVFTSTKPISEQYVTKALKAGARTKSTGACPSAGTFRLFPPHGRRAVSPRAGCR